MNIPKLDLNIIKSLISDQNISLEFSSAYSHELFSKDAQQFVKCIIEYIKMYKSMPTKRVLIDHFGGEKNISAYIDEVWNKLESIDYDVKEYSFDIESLKKRYSEALIKNLNGRIKEQELGAAYIDHKSIVKDIQNTVQRINSLSGKKAFIQKTLKEDIDSFKSEYSAKKNRVKPTPAYSVL
jgi:hypothetical protein